MASLQFAKGHGTENDFVVLADPDGVLEMTGARVRALCDRRRGLGADGVLRVVPAGAVAGAPAELAADTWFMDYRNADGSIAEMCGNGVRVFARYLVDSGLAAPGELVVGTRAGKRTVNARREGDVSVDMGAARAGVHSKATLGGQRFEGVAIDVGNPHLACVTDTAIETLDLTAEPDYDRTLFPEGVNLELVRPEGADRVRMRVHERGVGETRSCGTGTVAATLAALRARGQRMGSCEVLVPGGSVQVEITGSTSILTGPAVLVARGELDADWWMSIA